MAHCLITGGAGFIGSHLSERLLALDEEVTVLDDLSTGQKQNIYTLENHPNFHFRNGSIADSKLLDEILAGIDTIYHLAAAVGVKLVADDPVRTIETNIFPTEKLLQLAVQRGQKFFLASTSEVFGKNPKENWTEEDDLHLGPTSKPRWAYGCSKAIDEFLALAYHRKYGLEVIVGRFFNVVGPRQVGRYGMVIPRFVEAAVTGEPIVVYDDGLQERCFGHVREVVDCVIELVNHPKSLGRVFNIGSDQAISIRDLATMIKERAGSDSPIEFLPYNKAYSEDFEDVRRRVPNLGRLVKAIGKKPSMSLEDILDDIIAWKREELAR